MLNKMTGIPSITTGYKNMINRHPPSLCAFDPQTTPLAFEINISFCSSNINIEMLPLMLQ